MNDELLIKFLLNEASEEEAAEVRLWIAADAENQKYYNQFERIWNESATLAPTQVVDEEEAWQRFKKRVDEKQTAIPVVRKLRPAKMWLRIAAVFIFCVGAWLVYHFSRQYTEVASQEVVLNTALPDGSQLVLNRHTNISFAKDFKTNRQLALIKGEVFFDVAHNRSHPFVINMDKVQVEVVGTSFNIKRSKDTIEVIVETGIVKINKGNQEVRLTKGERVLLTDNESQLTKQQTEDELYNYYRTQLFITNDTPLPRLINTLNEAYGAQVVLSEQVKNERISTTLPFKYSLEKNLARICQTLDLKMQRNQNTILLSKK